MSYSTPIKVCVYIVRFLLDIIYLPIVIINFFKTPEKCPPMTDDLLLIPAADLAESIRKKKIRSTKVVKTYILRIREVNPIINAVIEDRFQEALKEAKKTDEFIKNCTLTEEEIKTKYPLLGVPISIKGSIAVSGMMHTSGRIDRQIIAENDAICIKYAREAGAIPLVTTNTPELCLNWETTNKLIGTTGNPYNNTRTAGGSSGGEASLIGSGGSLIGVGSDIGGSLRWPAHCCGIWGHKPSPFVVSTVGHYPDCKNKQEWNQVFTLGPLTRYATDLRYFLDIIAEPAMRDLLKLSEKVDIKKVKVYYLEDIDSILTKRSHEDVIKTIRRVIAHFDRICDTKSVLAQVPLMNYCSELSYARLLNIDDVDNIFNGKGDGSYVELIKYFGCQSKHVFTSILYGILRKNVGFIPTKSMNAIYNHLDKMRNDFIKMLGDDGVFIIPTNPNEATYHGDVYRTLFSHGRLSIFNALGLPATNCPISFSKNGLPIGIQVVAGPNLDRLCLCVAEELERTFGGWKPH